MKTTELFQEFIEWKELKELSPLSLRRYRSIFERLEESLPVQVEQVTFQHLKNYLRDREISVKTRYDETALIKSLFAFAVKGGYLERNPAALLPLPKLPHDPPPALTREEYEKLLELAATPTLNRAIDKWYAARNVAIIAMLVDSGVRVSELCAMKWRDVDLSARIAMVWGGKGNQNRVVVLTSRACQLIAAHWRQQKTGERLVENPDGSPVSYHGVYKLMKRLGARLGINLYPHLLRHTYATISIQNGADVTYVSKQLGHKSLDTTMIYVCLPVADRLEKHDCFSPLR